MDVTCANCGETWNTYHLREDEVHETPAGAQWIEYKLDCEDHEKELCRLSPGMRTGFKKPTPPNIERWTGKLTPFWREQFATRGWKFGSSVTVVLRCVRCKGRKALPDAEERGLLRRTVGELLEGDEDGIDAELEDLAIAERYSP